MESMDQDGLATPKIRGRLRRRPIPPIGRARSLLQGVIALVAIIAGMLAVAAVVFNSSAAGIGNLPDDPGVLVRIAPAYGVAFLAWLATRGFRDRAQWSLLLGYVIGIVLIVGGLYLINTVVNPADGKPLDGNAGFGIDALAGLFLVFGVPLVWNLTRGIRWFTDVEAKKDIKTEATLRAETARIVVGEPGAAGTVARPADQPLVSVRGLKKHFPIFGGVLRRQVGTIYAVDGVNFDVMSGEVFSVVGESGCGKTTLGRTLLQLTPSTDGRVVYDGYELADVDADDMRPLRRRMQIIFQDPFGSLNPRMPVSDIVGEGLLAQGVSNRVERDQRVGDALELVGLRRAYSRRYPHEFSGGQRQRIGVARALVLNPDFVVCDEPVSALDVSIQSQVLNLLLDLKRDLNLTYLFISHNLSVVEYFSDRIAVMYLGKIVELGTVEELYRNPRHPYTVALLSAIPVADPRRRSRRLVLKGDVPSPANPPSGCRFNTRCWLRERLGNPEQCVTTEPQMHALDTTGHQVACHFPEEVNQATIESAVETQSPVETAVAG